MSPAAPGSSIALVSNRRWPFRLPTVELAIEAGGLRASPIADDVVPWDAVRATPMVYRDGEGNRWGATLALRLGDRRPLFLYATSNEQWQAAPMETFRRPGYRIEPAGWERLIAALRERRIVTL
jgi:hypothetical protein